MDLSKLKLTNSSAKFLESKTGIFSAVYQSRSQTHVENRNRIISETLSGADSKGDIKCDMDLELYIAEAEIKANQLIVTDGSTAFERCNGEPPRTVNASLAAPAVENTEACIERMNDIDAKVVGQFTGAVTL
jgi:hypothetical protein